MVLKVAGDADPGDGEMCSVYVCVYMCCACIYVVYMVYGQSICGMFMCGMCSICVYIL